MLKERIAGFVDEVRAIDGIEGAALVTKDGVMIGRSFPREISEKWFAAMSASVLASAESAASIIGITPPVRVRIDAASGCILLHDAGDKLLVVAVLAPGAEPDDVLARLEPVARQIGEAF
jgi:predicted regulator of Ras-like GTPase activity (Roadblock/LC7/MglB family)